MTSSDIKDAIGRTLLLSENVQSTVWWAPGQPPHEANVGMVFFVEKGNPNEPAPATKKINVGLDDTPAPNDYNYARPSSNHSEGVCVAYADGGARCRSLIRCGPAMGARPRPCARAD